jgi:hypothetical protein
VNGKARSDATHELSGDRNLLLIYDFHSVSIPIFVTAVLGAANFHFDFKDNEIDAA